MGAKGVILAVAGAAAIAAAAGAYLFLVKKGGGSAFEGAGSAVDSSAFEGEDVEDSLGLETPPGDVPESEGVEGDPWLDPGDEGEPIEGSGDFVEEEPFEDVYAPGAAPLDRGDPPASDPIDPAELPADPPKEGEPKPSEPGQ